MLRRILGVSVCTLFAAMVVGVPLLSLADVPVEPRGNGRANRRPAPPASDGAVMAPVRVNHQAPGAAAEGAVARIVIPRAYLQELLASGAVSPALPIGSGSGNGSGPHYGTLVAGIALALAIASVPFVLRGRRATRQLVAASLLFVVVLGGWTWAYGDLIPGRPGGPPRRPAPPAGAQISLEIVEEGETVQLWVKPQGR
ncbi:MAG: hypothetical protein U0935_19565 [Pirellulales bacterium]